jgi:hypothetical protein
MSPPPSGSATAPICEAIASLRRLAFEYEGHPRLVEPYVHGFSQGGESLRAIQVGGSSRSKASFDKGKLFTVAKMTGVRVTNESFVADDLDYNPDDSAMLRIHCRVEPARTSPMPGKGRGKPK